MGVPSVRRKKKEYKERAQPASRRRFGLLEKHKDYKKRARDAGRKREELRRLQEAAATRNPDEFNFAMERRVLKRGEARQRQDPKLGERTRARRLREYAVQEAQLSTALASERSKREALQSTLHLLDRPSGETGEHLVFVDTPQELAEFDAATYLDTDEKLLGRTFNRPRRHQLQDESLVQSGRDSAVATTRREDAQERKQNRKLAAEGYLTVSSSDAYKRLLRRQAREAHLEYELAKATALREAKKPKDKHRRGVTDSTFVRKT